MTNNTNNTSIFDSAQIRREERGNVMKYGYKVVRKLTMASLRSLCVEKEWYTSGDNDEYSDMLAMAKKEDITSDDIVEIATDIIEHSDLSLDDFTYVCNEILKKSYSFMVES